MSRSVSKMQRCWIAALLLACASLAKAASNEDPSRAFEEANRLYAQEKFSAAAATYQQSLAAGAQSAEIYYNLGNACFKSGQIGRAIAAYRKAQMLDPRDANLRFNLEFARKHVSGDERDPRPRWQQWIQHLTLNEWAGLAMLAYWVCAALLIASEIWRGNARTLRPYIAISALATVAFLACLITANYATTHANAAVVVVSNAVVRRGPLEEAPVSYQLPDGSEVNVLDEKELTVGERKQSWLQVQNGRRVGWLQSDQVVLLQQKKRAAA